MNEMNLFYARLIKRTLSSPRVYDFIVKAYQGYFTQLGQSLVEICKSQNQGECLFGDITHRNNRALNSVFL